MTTAQREIAIGRLFCRSKVLGYVNEQMLSVYRDRGVVVKNEEINPNKTAEDRSIYQLVEPGWLVVNRMKAWQGAVGIADLRGIVSGHYICFRPNHGENHRYLHYLLRSAAFTARFAAISRGVRPGQIEIDNYELASTRLSLPTLQAQGRIADFLDDQVARIDNIIAARSQQEELHHAALQAEIDRMFGSGAEMVRMSHLARVLPGWAFPSDGYSSDESNVRLLRGVNVGVGHVRWDEVVYWPNAPQNEVSAFELADGDVVLGMDRPWIGNGLRIARITEGDLPCLLLQRVAKVIAGPKVEPGYLYWAYRASTFRTEIEAALTGLSVPHLSGDQILQHRLPLVGLAKQQKVITYLDSLDAEIDQGSLQHLRSVSLLTELKRSLITAAVTGEFDVSTADGSRVPT